MVSRVNPIMVSVSDLYNKDIVFKNGGSFMLFLRVVKVGFILIFLFIMIASVFAQSSRNRPDDQFEEIATVKKADALYKEGFKAFRMGDNERCISLTTESLEIGKKLKNSKIIGRALNNPQLVLKL